MTRWMAQLDHVCEQMNVYLLMIALGLLALDGMFLVAELAPY